MVQAIFLQLLYHNLRLLILHQPLTQVTFQLHYFGALPIQLDLQTIWLLGHHRPFFKGWLTLVKQSLVSFGLVVQVAALLHKFFYLVGLQPQIFLQEILPIHEVDSLRPAPIQR